MPLLSNSTKSYKEVSETVISQLKTVFEAYQTQTTNVSNRKCLNCGVYDAKNDANSHQFVNTMEMKSVLSKSQSQKSLTQHLINAQHLIGGSCESQHPGFNQTQDMLTENEYLKKQVAALKVQLDETVNEAQQVMEETQTKEMELKELVEMVRTYEDQIRELQTKLEEKITAYKQREQQKQQQRQALEIQQQQEMQLMKSIFQEFISAKSVVEYQIEDLIKKVLEFDGISTKSKALGMPQHSNKPFKEKCSNQEFHDIIRSQTGEMNELTEALKDLASLVTKTMTEKRDMKVELQKEIDLKQEIEEAINSQDSEGLSTDLLIMKIKTLEHSLNAIQQIFHGQALSSTNTGPTISKSCNSSPIQQKKAQYQAYQQLRVFNSDFIDDKVRLHQKICSLEKQNTQSREDIENLMSRLAEQEKENFELKSNGQHSLAIEKKQLLHEVEDIRVREEQLEVVLQHKFEMELIKMQENQEMELKAKFIISLVEMLKLSQLDNDFNESSFEQQLSYCQAKAETLYEKIEVLQENKDLMMKERMIFDEKLQEVAEENVQLAKKVDTLQQQLHSTNYAYQQELKMVREERDKLNANANLLMNKFRQAASDLHEVREEKDKISKDSFDLKNALDQTDKRFSKIPTSSVLQSKSLGLQNDRPPLGLIRADQFNSPIGQNSAYKLGGALKYNIGQGSGQKKPVMVYHNQYHTNQHPIKRAQPVDKVKAAIDNQNLPLQSSLNEQQLSDLIQGYKAENQKFSQEVHDLQSKIQKTNSLSTFKLGAKLCNPRANSCQPVGRSTSRTTSCHSNGNLVDQNDSNSKQQHFSTINNDQKGFKAAQDVGQMNSSSSQNSFRTISFSAKKRQGY